jgi:hypothetical protein
MSYADTERFIKDKLREINKYKDAPEEELPECTSEELWEKPSIYSYYKNPEKMDRSTKNFDTYWEAHQKLVSDGLTGIIVERKGQIIFCNYCPAKNSCKQAKRYIDEGRLLV